MGKLYTHFLVLLSRGEPLFLDSCHVEYICVGKSQFQIGVGLLETRTIEIKTQYLPQLQTIEEHVIVSSTVLVYNNQTLDGYVENIIHTYREISELSRHVLHECHRHECNAALTMSDTSCMHEIIDLS